MTAADAWEPQGLVFEATAPDAAVGNLARCIEAQVPVVTGTTGWLERLDEVRDLSLRADSTAFYSTNFSPGVHALNAIAKHAAGVFNQIPGYAPHIREVHHVHKKDAPSGTALTLAEHVTDGGWTRTCPSKAFARGKSWVCMLWRGTLRTMPLFCSTKPKPVLDSPRGPSGPFVGPGNAMRSADLDFTP